MPPASPDRARIVFDCRTVNDPAMMSSTISAHVFACKPHRMNFLFQVVIPAISGLVSGAIASLVAPWVNWRIEQKREKLAYKKEMIRRWREFLDRDFDETEFSGTAVYSEISTFHWRMCLKFCSPSR
jgi:hypothetical protein